MKRKDKYYSINPYYDKITIDEWFEQKDHCFKLWQGHITLKKMCKINLQPKHRHKRRVMNRKLWNLVYGDNLEFLNE